MAQPKHTIVLLQETGVRVEHAHAAWRAARRMRACAPAGPSVRLRSAIGSACCSAARAGRAGVGAECGARVRRRLLTRVVGACAFACPPVCSEQKHADLQRL